MAIFEKRSADIQRLSDFPGLIELLGTSNAGARVNRHSAMRLAAVYSCVDALSKDRAGLPIHVKRRTEKGVEKVPEHPAYQLLKLRPNAEMTAFTGKRTGMWHALLEGNQYTFVERSAMNPVKALWPLHPDNVRIERTKVKRGRGAITYKVQDGYTWKSYRPENILHIKDQAADGVKGESTITLYAREQIGLGIEMDRFQGNFFRNGMNPGGIFEHPKHLGDNKESFVNGLKRRFGGNRNSKVPMVLEDGMKFTPYEVKMVDQQFLELLKVNKADICGIFGVPQSRIGISDSNTNFNNTEQENRRYVQAGLLPWAIQEEQEMDYKLLTTEERAKGFFIKYNFDAFLRGDTKTQAENDQRYWRMGVPINRLLSRRDENPVPGGDVGRVQLNTVSLTEADDYLQGKNDRSRNPEKRSFETRSTEQVVEGRDRVTSRFYDLVKSAAQKIVNLESIAVKREVDKQLGERSTSDFNTWVDEFYADLPVRIKDTLGPGLRSLAETMGDLVAGEVDLDEIDEDLAAEIEEYIDGYTGQHLDSSKGQIRQILEEEGLEAIAIRMDEWHEKRADKIAKNETVGIGNMVASFVILTAGYRLKWHCRGKSCPLCSQLSGKIVSRRGEPFLPSGTTLEDGKGQIVEFKQTLYAPLHRGCDCVVMAA